MKILKNGTFTIKPDGKLVIAGWSIITDNRSLVDALKWLIFQAASNSGEFKRVSAAFASGDYEVTDFSASRG